MLHILHFKHYLFFPQSFQGVRAFPILRFSHTRRLFHRALGLFFGLRFPSVSPGLLIPAQLGWVARTGVYLCHCRWRIRAGMGWMVCCICLASNPALVAYESVLSGSASDYILLSPVLLWFFFALFSSLFFFYIRCCSRAVSRYPADFLPCWRNPINELRFFT